MNDDKPTLPTEPPPLASAYEHADRDTIPLFSHYKNNCYVAKCVTITTIYIVANLENYYGVDGGC